MGKYLTRVKTDFIFNSVDPAKMHRIMDLGAEAGRFSLLVADKNATVIGIDIDPYGMKRLNSKPNTSTSFKLTQEKSQ
jgi:tRNA1(Val) A37 N6-methylase TrmN6